MLAVPSFYLNPISTDRRATCWAPYCCWSPKAGRVTYPLFKETIAMREISLYTLFDISLLTTGSQTLQAMEIDMRPSKLSQTRFIGAYARAQRKQHRRKGSPAGCLKGATQGLLLNRLRSLMSRICLLGWPFPSSWMWYWSLSACSVGSRWQCCSLLPGTLYKGNFWVSRTCKW